MQFNYIENMVSLSPLDFGYKFGINDNSPDKFRYDNTVITSNIIAPLAISSVINIPNLIDTFDKITDEDNFEVTYMPANDNFNISLGDLNMQKMDKVKSSLTHKDYSNFAKNSFNTILNSTFKMINTLNTTSKTGQIIDLTSAVVDFAMNLTNMIMTAQYYDNMISEAKETNRVLTELLNEKIEANKEFIELCREKISQQKIKYSNVK